METKIKTKECFKPLDCKFEDDDPASGLPTESHLNFLTELIKEELEDLKNRLRRSTTNGSSPPNVTLKIEESKIELDHSSNEDEMDDQDLLRDENDTDDYICIICEKKFIRKYNYDIHLRNIHMMAITTRKKPKRSLHILPDENDPFNYCRSCEWIFNTRGGYLSHLRSVHRGRKNRTKKIGRPKMSEEVLKPLLPPRELPNPHILPDKDDPNNYCKSCKWTFSTKDSYYKHLICMHQI